MQSWIVRLQDVSFKRFTSNGAADGTLPILRNVNLEIADGEFVTIVGPNGCGKSTLLRIIADEVGETEGIIEGQVERDTSLIVGHSIGFLRQQPQLFPWLNVKSNVLFGPRCRRMPRPEQKKLFEDLDFLLELEVLAGKYVVSGGQRQKVALAQVLATKPKLLLLDEPFSALDPNVRDNVRKMIIDVQRQQGMTVIHVTHDLSEAVTMGDKVVVMSSSGDAGSEILATVPLGRAMDASPLSVERVRQAIAMLFAKRKDRILTMSLVRDLESSLESGDVVYIAAVEPEREYENRERNPFFEVVCNNIRNGISYCYFFPDYGGRIDQGSFCEAIPGNIRDLIECLREETGLDDATFCDRVSIAIAPRHHIFQLSGDCVIVERLGTANNGWFFPLAFDYDFIIQLSDERLKSTWEMLRQWRLGNGSRFVFPETAKAGKVPVDAER
jgi:NitT/TauT family transport system ATP-binding protein